MSGGRFEELETAGVAALTIEDTELPQSYGTVGGTRLISIEEGVGKMKAALDGRQDPQPRYCRAHKRDEYYGAGRYCRADQGV